jgi:hypothetical protein
VLKQAEDGTSVGEVCRKTGISEATLRMAQEVCGSDALGDATSAPARGGERQAETVGR